VFEVQQAMGPVLHRSGKRGDEILASRKLWTEFSETQQDEFAELAGVHAVKKKVKRAATHDNAGAAAAAHHAAAVVAAPRDLADVVRGATLLWRIRIQRFAIAIATCWIVVSVQAQFRDEAANVSAVGTAEPIKNFTAMLNRRDQDWTVRALDGMQEAIEYV
jgi:hypothetical protein